MEKRNKRFGVSVTVVAGVATAMVIGAGGGAVGAALVTSAQIKDNTIRSADVRNGTLTGADVGDNKLTGVDVANGKLTGADVKDGSVGPADLTKDARTYWAAVRADGTIDRSSPGVTGNRNSAGRYTITFPTSVVSCGYVATRGTPDASNPVPGYIGVAPRENIPNAVWVEAQSTAAALADSAFYILVDC